MGEKYSREQFAVQLGANGAPKLNAAANFAARLPNGPAGPATARMLPFGSVQRGAPQQESDVDLLVFGAPEPEPVRDAAVETGLTWVQSVEPLIFGPRN